MEDQKLAVLVNKLLTDTETLESFKNEPVKTLNDNGVELNADQQSSLLEAIKLLEAGNQNSGQTPVKGIIPVAIAAAGVVAGAKGAAIAVGAKVATTVMGD